MDARVSQVLAVELRTADQVIQGQLVLEGGPGRGTGLRELQQLLAERPQGFLYLRHVQIASLRDGQPRWDTASRQAELLVSVAAIRTLAAGASTGASAGERARGASVSQLRPRLRED